MPLTSKPTDREIEETIWELRSRASRLMQQASSLMEKAAKLEDAVARARSESEAPQPSA